MADTGDTDIPRLIADQKLRALRAEGGLSWLEFNKLWTITCNFVTASPDILWDGTLSRETAQDKELMELTADILASGLFGPRTRGRWTYESAAGKEAIHRYIQGLVAHVAEGMIDQIPEEGYQVSVETNNVHGWLMFENPDMFDEHIPSLEVPGTEDSWSHTGVSETCSCSDETVVPETICGPQDNPAIDDPWI